MRKNKRARAKAAPNKWLIGWKKYNTWILLLAVMAAVLYIRLLPLSLPLIDDIADASAYQQLQLKMQQKARYRFPRSQQASLDDQVRNWIEANRPEWDEYRTKTTQQMRSQLRYEGQDGKQYTYLGGLDSYYFLRLARNYLTKGTICDEVSNGLCWDTYRNAPLGWDIGYHYSLHVAAIVGLYRLIALVKPDYPLPATAYWVPVIIGMLGVLPAFALGRRFGGTGCGLIAAAQISLYPLFLNRSIGSDNDVWNVVLPVFTAWAIMHVLTAEKRFWQVIYAVLAVGFLGLLAANWSGWLFFYTVFVTGLLIYLLLTCFQWGIDSFKNRRLGGELETGRIGLIVVLLFFAAGVIGIFMASAVKVPYFDLPLHVFNHLKNLLFPDSSSKLMETEWPDAFGTVHELEGLSLSLITQSVGSVLLWLFGFVGLLLLLLPKTNWDWRHWTVLVIGLAVNLFLVATNQFNNLAIILLAVPVMGALLILLFEQQAAGRPENLGISLIMMIWFLGALSLVLHGNRYLLLWGPPFGIGLAVAVSRLAEVITKVIPKWSPRYPEIPGNLLIFLVLSWVVWLGYDTAYKHTPAIDDAWWDTLTDIRTRAEPNAIVTALWDYGYWVKYIADRSTSADGGMLRSRMPYWTSKVLGAASEEESVGVLRMLNCRSDEEGAYGVIRRMGRDPLLSHLTVAELVRRSESEGRLYLIKQGFSAAQQAEILDSIYCTPPESYLVVSSRETDKVYAWMHLGLWDPRRAYMVQSVRALPEVAAMKELIERLGYAEQEAAVLYRQVSGLKTKQDLDNFITHESSSMKPESRPCFVQNNTGVMTCRWDADHVLTYNIFSPYDFNFSFPVSSSEGNFYITPGVVFVVRPDRLQKILLKPPSRPEIAVLLDPSKGLMLLGPTPFINSTLVHLVYLDGRYSKNFEKIGEDKISLEGDRVSIWRVRWNPDTAEDQL